LVLLADLGLLGPVGRSLKTGLELLVGLGRWVLPIILLGVGAALLTGRLDVDSRRLALGLPLVLMAICGLADVLGSQPHFSDGASVLGAGGGWLGAAVGGGLRHALGSLGAVVVLLALFVVGGVLTTGVTVRQAFATSVAVSRRLASLFAQLVDSPSPAGRDRGHRGGPVVETSRVGACSG
jgi:hypothetical protein